MVNQIVKTIHSSKEAVLEYLKTKTETKGKLPLIAIRLMSEEERKSLGVPKENIAWAHCLQKNNKPIFFATFYPSTKNFTMIQVNPLQSPFISPQELLESTFKAIQEELEKLHREMIPENEKITVTIRGREGREREVTLTKREERMMMGKKRIIYDVHETRSETHRIRDKLVQSGKYPDYHITSTPRRTIIFEEKKKKGTT